jgi:hypothetical protein
MLRFLRIIVILLGLTAVSVFLVLFTKKQIKAQVAKKISTDFGLSHQAIKVNLWNGSVEIDSLTGFGNTGSLARLKVRKLDWLKLYHNRNIKLNKVCLNVTGLQMRSNDGLHILKIDSISKEQGTIHLLNLNISSLHDRETFYKTVKKRKPRLSLKIPSMQVMRISNHPLHISRISASEADIEIEEDLNQPPSTTKKKLLTELIHDINQDFIIDSISITKSKFKYIVKDQGSAQWGDLVFDNCDLNIKNITNDSLSLMQNAAMIMDFKSEISGTSNLHVITKHFLQSPTYQYDVYAMLSNYDLRRANSIIAPAKGIDIESGHINTLQLNGSFNDFSSQGTIKIDYMNLSVNFNKELLGVADFIGNSMIKQKAKEEQIFNEKRNANRSFTAHIWLSVSKALKKIITVLPIN